MFKTKDVMIEDLITIQENTSIYDAMHILVENKITGLPVVSDGGKMLGILSEKDMLELLFKPNPSGVVADFMTRNVFSVNEDDDLADVTECLIKNNFRRVPVLSNGKLVGIITRRDIIKFILHLRKIKKSKD